MAQSVEIKVDGLDELIDGLTKVKQDLSPGVRAALGDLVDTLADEVRPTVPKDTGAARRSIRGSLDREGASLIGGDDQAYYYVYLEADGGYIKRVVSRVRSGSKLSKTAEKALRSIFTAAGVEIN